MQKAALLVIDVQKIMFDPEPVYKSEELLRNLQMLIGDAREADVPVIYIQHNGPEGAPHAPGGPGWDIHPDVAPKAGEVVIQKTTPDSFCQTPLKETLSQMEIHKLIVTGIQTDYCVDTTCRRASSEGYEVTLVTDAHSTWSNEHITAEQAIAHHNDVLGNWFAKPVPAKEVQFEV